jgi:hypothetical protein
MATGSFRPRGNCAGPGDQEIILSQIFNREFGPVAGRLTMQYKKPSCGSTAPRLAQSKTSMVG